MAAFAVGCTGTSTQKGCDAVQTYLAGLDPFLIHSSEDNRWIPTPVGTTPHALSCLMPNGEIYPEVLNTLLFTLQFPDKPAVILNDYSGKELEVTEQGCKILYKTPNYWGVRLDTCGERNDLIFRPMADMNLWSQQKSKWMYGPGVSVGLCKKVREVMNKNNCKDKNIMISSGFNLEKIKFFLENDAPFDAIGTGSFVEFGKITADIIKVNNNPVVKAGREWLYTAEENFKGE